MRTTLDIDDHVLRRAKQLAAQRGTTLTALIEDGLREVLIASETRAAYTYEPVTVEGEWDPSFPVDDRRRLYDRLDPLDERYPELSGDTPGADG